MSSSNLKRCNRQMNSGRCQKLRKRGDCPAEDGRCVGRGPINIKKDFVVIDSNPPSGGVTLAETQGGEVLREIHV